VSSGGAIIDAMKLLRADGLHTNLALCVIDRQSGGSEALAADGIELRALLTYSQITDA
jgi:orotate phosphoribosyltransferase